MDGKLQGALFDRSLCALPPKALRKRAAAKDSPRFGVTVCKPLAFPLSSSKGQPARRASGRCGCPPETVICVVPHRGASSNHGINCTNPPQYSDAQGVIILSSPCPAVPTSAADASPPIAAEAASLCSLSVSSSPSPSELSSCALQRSDGTAVANDAFSAAVIISWASRRLPNALRACCSTSEGGVNRDLQCGQRTCTSP